MGLKIDQNINFRSFLVFSSVLGLDDSFSGRDSFFGRDQVSWPRQLVTTVSGQQLVFLLQLVGAITSLF